MSDNQYKISVEQAAEWEGFRDRDALLREYVLESVVPACCKEGCQVEPDGRCEHGCPSILIEMGLI